MSISVFSDYTVSVNGDDIINSSSRGITTVGTGSVNAVYNQTDGTIDINVANRLTLNTNTGGLDIKPTGDNSGQSYESFFTPIGGESFGIYADAPYGDYTGSEQLPQIWGFGGGSQTYYLLSNGYTFNHANISDTAYGTLMLGNSLDNSHIFFKQDTALGYDVVVNAPRYSGTLAAHKTGTNGTAGTSSAMSSGTITISTNKVRAGSIIFLTGIDASVGTATNGVLSVGTIVDGVSFDINSSNPADTRTVQWWVLKY